MILDWNAGNFIDEKVKAIRAQVGNGTVVLGLSAAAWIPAWPPCCCTRPSASS